MAETNPTSSYFYNFKKRNPHLFDTQADRERTEQQQDLASMQQSLEIPVSTSSELDIPTPTTPISEDEEVAILNSIREQDVGSNYRRNLIANL